MFTYLVLQDSHITLKFVILDSMVLSWFHGTLFFQPEGTFIEWKAEEILQVDGQNEQDWAVIGSSLSVGYKPDTGSGSDVPSKPMSMLIK